MQPKTKFPIHLGIALTCSLFSLENNPSDYKHVEACIYQDQISHSDDTVQEDILFVAEQSKARLRLSRTDQIPREHLRSETASYLEGYIQALIDANYYELNVLVWVNQDGVVYLYNLPNDKRIKNSIIAFVRDLPEVTDVREGEIDEHIEERLQEKQPIRKLNGVWFPESTVLFDPLIANPREPVYSIAYRWFDKVIARNQIAVSLGDTFPIFRWFNVFPAHGDLQIDIAACMWADFNMHPHVHPNNEWAELVNTDYLLSIPLSYSFDRWSFRLRIYHISSHLGDEFMCNQPEVNRVNPSFEAIDFFTSFQASEGLRLYVGPGVIINSDTSYPMKVFYFEYGTEVRFTGLRYNYHLLYGAPFFALDVQQWQANHFQPSVTAQFGYEWSKLQGAGRKIRLFVEFHNGQSEGQFFGNHTKYLALRGSWGF